MTAVFDTGALLALERGSAEMHALRRTEVRLRRPPFTHGGVIGQAWRGGTGRQVLLARALAGVDVHALDNLVGRAAGVLLRESGTSDVIDAALVVIANEGDVIYTSDPTDIRHLAAVASKRLSIVAV